MIRCDAFVVGGGPAGSTCAWALRRAGWDVVVADRARFPRDKVCAGWLTPDVFRLLELDPSEYRASGATLQEIAGFRTGVLGAPLVETRNVPTLTLTMLVKLLAALLRCSTPVCVLLSVALPLTNPSSRATPPLPPPPPTRISSAPVSAMPLVSTTVLVF